MKTAFVAMKFNKRASKDPWYALIREVLLEAGFDSVRADEIKTSGPVVDEVCRLLASSDLVVLDSTGDSHSVSYEVGYCHGVNRPAESTILLRKDSHIPFNYRHFRHQVYKSGASLRTVLRRFLGVSDPISGSAYAYVLSFEVVKRSLQISPDIVARAVQETALRFRLTGRLETYAEDGFIHMEFWGPAARVTTRLTPQNSERIFRFGFCFAAPKKKDDFELMQDLAAYLSSRLHLLEPRLVPAESLSEGGTLRAVREGLKQFAFADFIDGAPSALIYPHINPLRPATPS